MKLNKYVKVLMVVVTIVFVLAQFIQPNRDNPSVDNAMTMQSQLNIPPSIASLLQRGCQDCHSNQTHWPFYAYVAPASWLVSYDVMEGRKNFNMSEWGKYKQSKMIKKLSGIYEAVADRSMPLPKYVPLHPESKFTDAERDSLSSWARTETEKMMSGGE